MNEARTRGKRRCGQWRVWPAVVGGHSIPAPRDGPRWIPQVEPPPSMGRAEGKWQAIGRLAKNLHWRQWLCLVFTSSMFTSTPLQHQIKGSAQKNLCACGSWWEGDGKGRGASSGEGFHADFFGPSSVSGCITPKSSTALPLVPVLALGDKCLTTHGRRRWLAGVEWHHDQDCQTSVGGFCHCREKAICKCEDKRN